MSISLILIPAALAAVAAVTATGTAGMISLSGDQTSSTEGRTATEDSGGARPVAVQTRMKDPDLLGAALADIGATQVSVSGDQLTALVDGIELTMARGEDGVWAAHFVRADGLELGASEATALVEKLDAAYALQVQAAVAARIRSRAADAGFELVSEQRDEEDTVTMVLSVKDYA